LHLQGGSVLQYAGRMCCSVCIRCVAAHDTVHHCCYNVAMHVQVLRCVAAYAFVVYAFVLHSLRKYVLQILQALEKAETSHESRESVDGVVGGGYASAPSHVSALSDSIMQRHARTPAWGGGAVGRQGGAPSSDDKVF